MREDVLSLRAMGGTGPRTTSRRTCTTGPRPWKTSPTPPSSSAASTTPTVRPEPIRNCRRRRRGTQLPHRPSARARAGRHARGDRLAAPVSRPFYRASARTLMNLARRRRFGFSGGELTAYEDEVFAAVPRWGGGRRGGWPGPFGQKPPDPAQPDPDRRDRAAARRDRCGTSSRPSSPTRTNSCGPSWTQTVCVQGAPGTGKTAVGLHRVGVPAVRVPGAGPAAWRGRGRAEPGLPLLHPQRPARAGRGRRRPRPPSTTWSGRSGTRGGPDDEAAAIVKGDARMAEVLRRALLGVIRRPGAGCGAAGRGAGGWLAWEVRGARATRCAGRRALRHGPRAGARARTVHVILTPAGGRRGGLPTSRHPRGGAAVRAGAGRSWTTIWPKVDPVRLVFGLLSTGGGTGRGGRRGAAPPTSRPRSSGRRPPRTGPVGPLVRGGRGAHRRGAELIDRLPSLGPRGRGRGPGPVPDGVPGASAAGVHRLDHRARRPRPGHHAVGGAVVAVAAGEPGQAGHRRAGAPSGLPRAPADPGLRLDAARDDRPRADAAGPCGRTPAP